MRGEFVIIRPAARVREPYRVEYVLGARRVPVYKTWSGEDAEDYATAQNLELSKLPEPEEPKG